MNETKKRPRGRPSKDGGRITVSVCLSPENAALREKLGRNWNDYVNLRLDEARKQTGK